MGALDILIKLQQSGGNAVSAVFRTVGSDARDMTKEVEAAAEQSTALETALDNVNGDSLSQTATQARDLDKSLDESGNRADALRGRLESVRDAGLKISAVGAVGAVLSEHLSDSFLEADRLSGKLDSLLKGKGLGDSIDKVKELGNTLAGLTGGDDDALSTALGAAVASGRLNGLREYGIVIDANGQAAIAAAGKVSAQAKAQETLNQVLRAGASAADNLRAGMDDATVALGEMDVRMGNAEEEIGQGSARAKAALYEGILSPILDIVEASPGLATSAGYVVGIGSAGVSAIGGVISLGAQIGLLTLSFPTMGATAATAFASIKAGAAAAVPALLSVARALAVPLAILTAGVAVGVALYETLRAANIGGFGDTHKSTSDILADTRKMMMGDTDAEIKKAEVAAKALAPTTAAATVAAAPLTAASASVAAQQTAPGVTTAGAGAAASAPVKAAKEKTDQAQEKYLKHALELPAEVLNKQGEKNVQAQMSKAKALFDGLDEAASRKRFEAMADLFEKKSGFEGEAELEAAKRVFQEKFGDKDGRAKRVEEAILKGARLEGIDMFVPDGVLKNQSDEDALFDALSKKSGKAAKTKQSVTKREPSIADAFAYARAGRNIFDLKKGTATGSNSGSQADSGGDIETITVRPQTRVTQNAQGKYLLEILPTVVELPGGTVRPR